MVDDSGACLSAPGSHPSDQAPTGLGAPRFDPSRGRMVELPPHLVVDIPIAMGLIELAKGWGHGPAAHCGKGERMAGVYYSNDDARDAGVLPAHAVGAIMRIVAELHRLTSDSDGSPQGGDGEAGSVHDSAGPEGIAKDQVS